MRINQINLQHCKAASAELSRRFGMNHFDICLIQEPYICKDRVRGLESSGDIVYQPGLSKPRTCIYIKKNLNYLPLTQYCTGDETVIKLTFEDLSGSKLDVVLCSAYFPYDSVDSPPNKNICELVESCRQSKLPLLIACDSNAHNIVWGSSDTNLRGIHVLDFIVEKDLLILNEGNEPTFLNSTRSEVLDLTICNKQLETKLRNWHVSEESTLSDHRYILYEIVSVAPLLTQTRNPRKTNWELFQKILEKKSIDLYDLNPTNDMECELYANKLHSAIISAYEASCESRTLRTNRKCPWFSPKLARLRKEVRKLWNKSKKKVKLGLLNDPIVLKYKESLTNYSKEVNNSKTASWRKRCEELSNTDECSRLHKLLSADSFQKLGSLKDKRGHFSSNAKESLDILLDTHFPDSIRVDRGPIDSSNFSVPTENLLNVDEIVSTSRIEWAIGTFKPYKSPGSDGIFPALLQQGKHILTQHLGKLFKYSLMTGYIPKSWGGANVVFIPKPGKASYSDPKSFRPISLMSFVLKTLEKLVDRFIRETSLDTLPLHKYQYAYQTGKSTESALHQAVSKLEKTIHDKDIGIVALLDIEGAFDNTAFDVIVKAARKFGIDTHLIRWIFNMLSNRTIKATLHDVIILIRPTKGTPQGGCLSTLLWSLVVDSLLCELNRLGGVLAVGYADDIFIHVTGKFETTVSEVMQGALTTAENWCKLSGLAINPNKAIVMPVTNRYKYKLKTLKLFGHELPFVKEAKYLGVTLDTRLNFEGHVSNVIAKCTKSFWACRSMVGKNWGLTPKMTRWIYKQVIIPRLTYGCVVWWHRATKTNFQSKLVKLQRMAGLCIAGTAKTTPTAALDAALMLPPLELVVEARARCTAVRLASCGTWFGWNQPFGHCALSVFLKKNPDYWTRPDRISGYFNFSKTFEIIINNRDEVFDFDNLEPDTVIWFTDGAKNSEGVGAGIYCNNPPIELNFSISEHATVFQAELLAIERCAKICLTEASAFKNIIIATDSQAALRSLGACKVSSKTTLGCIQALNKLSPFYGVKLVWIPGHSGIAGNEMADQLAKSAAHSEIQLHNSTIMDRHWKLDVKRWLLLKHNQYFRAKEGLRTSKAFLSVNDKKSMDLLSFSKHELRLLLGVLTGHCRLKKYLHDIGVSRDPVCRFCNNKVETSMHLLCECAELAEPRRKLLGSEQVDAATIKKAKYSIVLDFLKCSGISELINTS
jgi:ribonuclease HI